ncbi:unnamed protein product [Cunninghamella blakesleeana]
MSTKTRQLLAAKAAIKAAAETMQEGQKVVAQFKTEDGESTGPPLNLPADVTPEQLELLLNQLPLYHDHILKIPYHILFM